MATLREIVVKTLKQNNLNVRFSDQIVSSLKILKYPKFVVNSTLESRIVEDTKKHAHRIGAISNPLIAPSSDNMNCVYCKKPMIKISLNGDVIKEAMFCPDDRIVIPLQKL